MHAFLPLLLGAAAVPSALAHVTFTNFFVDGQPVLDGKCVRMNRDAKQATFPVENVSGPDMACGFNGEVGLDRVCPAKAGAQVTMEFRARPDTPGGGTIDGSHKGPCAVYMKKVDDASASDNAQGPGWFKIWQEDYDAGAKKWCTEKLAETDGWLTVTIPPDVRGGHYLLRPELLALHAADKTPPDPQFYVGCAQLFVTGGGGATPLDTVAIPGHVSMEKNHAAMTFSIWKEPMALPYPMFGPKPYAPSANPQRRAAAAVPSLSLLPRTSQSTQQTGLVPADCVFENDNWCGLELPSYADEAGCWKASQACWDQGEHCWHDAAATGGRRCDVWEAKCKGIQDACNARNFVGPPNQGKIITPPLPKPGSLPPPRSSSGNYDGGSVGSTDDATAGSGSSGSGSSGGATPKGIRPYPGPPSPHAAAPAAAASPAAPAAPAVPAAPAALASGSENECGSRNGETCGASKPCCSAHGYCGASDAYCGDGCQGGFGKCGSGLARRGEHLRRHVRHFSGRA